MPHRDRDDARNLNEDATDVVMIAIMMQMLAKKKMMMILLTRKIT